MSTQQQEGGDEKPSDREIYQRNVQRARAVTFKIGTDISVNTD
ncbi:hypothetical protein [Natronorubrum sp. A-ect3]